MDQKPTWKQILIGFGIGLLVIAILFVVIWILTKYLYKKPVRVPPSYYFEKGFFPSD
jgi:hypothetical protein